MELIASIDIFERQFYHKKIFKFKIMGFYPKVWGYLTVISWN